MRILRTAGWWLGALALAASGLLAFRYEHDLQYRRLALGDHLRPIRVSTLYGAPFVLRSAGRPLIINVFATWCEPCRAEMPEFTAAARSLRSRGVDVVGIDQQESGARVRGFVDDFHLPYQVYVDAIGISRPVLGARIIPTTIYVDASGVIRWEHSGPISARTLFAVASAEYGG